ncbi:MAG TPA: DUF4160 domain-containing protein [Longimicrobium sp.]|nr:DUF4160 domain-containing protein [Longimicrobium sp.]
MPPELHREDGFSIRIYRNDHPPPHVHVVKADGVMRIALGDADVAPWILSVSGMKPSDQARATQLVRLLKTELLIAWKEMRNARS